MRCLSVLVIMLTSLFFAGCGDDDEEEQPTAATAPAASSTAEPGEASSTAEDGTLGTVADTQASPAQAAMLTADDLGSGWAEQSDSPQAECIVAALEDIGPAGAVPGNGFKLEGSNQEARSQAWSFADEETASTAFSAATSDTVIQCFAGVKLAELEATGEVKEEDIIDATSEELNVDVGDESRAARARAQVRVAGQSAPLDLVADTVVARAGLVVVAYQFISQGEPVDEALESAAVSAAVGRVPPG
jgi:hypothetical protein